MRVLVIDPWGRGSHRAWADGWAAHSRHDVDVVRTASGSWRWRLRAGSAPLAAAVREHLAVAPRPDVVVVGGLVDVAQLVGRLRRDLDPDTPLVVMQHESQLVHPRPDGAIDDEAALRNWSSWQVADRVWWNSAFHCDAVLDALDGWLRSIPAEDRGGAPQEQIAALAERSEVVHLGIDPELAPSPRAPGPPVVVWPHRWEWDKDPEAFAATVRRLADDGVELRVVLAGDEPVVGRSGRERLAVELGERVVAVGPLERAEYLRWLARADLVVSCARHEFFGLAVAEAMASGCRPVVPDGLAYPEVVPPELRSGAYRPGTFGTALRRALAAPPDDAERQRISSATLARFAWPTIAARLDDAVDAL